MTEHWLWLELNGSIQDGEIHGSETERNSAAQDWTDELRGEPSWRIRVADVPKRSNVAAAVKAARTFAVA